MGPSEDVLNINGSKRSFERIFAQPTYGLIPQSAMRFAGTVIAKSVFLCGSTIDR